MKVHGTDTNNLGDILDIGKEEAGEQARMTGPNASITLLRDNMIKYTMILNLFTGEIFIGFEKGIFTGLIDDVKTVQDFKEPVSFRTDESMRMVTYTLEGKYNQNLLGTRLRFFNLEQDILKPGGPIRFTYLLEDTQKNDLSSVGVIAHNGEKVQESLPNIAIALFSRGELQAYKLFCDWDYNANRAGHAMAPVLYNSVYRGELMKTGLDVTIFNNHAYPSECRDTTVIIPSANAPAACMMDGMVANGNAIRLV